MSGLQLSLDWSPGAVESDGPFKCRVHSRDPLRVLMKKDCGPYMKAIELVPNHTITMCSPEDVSCYAYIACRRGAIT